MPNTALEPVPFTFDLGLKSADASASSAIQLEDGDLLIEGFGATLDVDREAEAFTDNAFSRGLQRFLDGNAPLCWHHNYAQVLGKVVDAEIVPGKGVKIRAVVDKQPESSPLYHAYQAIKKGRANGLSVGGLFRRIMTPEGPRIDDVDILEWSATATPVGANARFSVIAQKALEFKSDVAEPAVESVEEVVEVTPAPAEEHAVVVETPEETPVEETPEAEVTEEPTPEEKPELVIEPGTITDAHIASGSIKTEHLSDELRSRFSELAPEAPSIEGAHERLGTLSAQLETLFAKLGMEPIEETPAE